MKFDMLCSIILEGSKSDRFAKMVIGNAEPVFTIDDVLKDPNDPSRGLMTYLSHRDASGSEQPDPERLARRAVRRVNWVAKSAIKKLGAREISLDKLNTFIIDLLNKYQTKVLGYEKPDKAKTAYEARIIGNLLLPPTQKRPNAKGVFVVSPETVKTAKASGNIEAVDTEKISTVFNNNADQHTEGFDPDLVITIKEIVGGLVPMPLNTRDDEAGGITVSRILKDPRIKGIFDPRATRKVIKSMIEDGSLIQDEHGFLTSNEEDVESSISNIERAREDKDIKNLEDIPTEDDVEKLAGEFDEEESIPDIEDDSFDDEDEEGMIDTDDESAAIRLGYRDPDDEDESDEDSWYD